MIKKNLPYIFLLLASTVIAGEHFDRGVLRVLGEANQQKLVNDKALCLSVISSAGASASPVSTQEMNECVFALCGSPAENKSVYITDKNFEQYVSPEIKKQISVLGPNLKKILDKERRTKLKNFEDMQALLRGVNPDQWKPEFRADMSYKLFKPYLSERIDFKKPYAERYVLEVKGEKNLSPEFKTQLLIYKERYEKFIKNDVNSFLEKGLYSDSEQRQIAKDRLVKMQKEFDRVLPSLNKGDKKNLGERLKSLVDDFDKMDEAEVDIFLINLSFLENQIADYSSSSSLKIQRPSCDRSPFCTNALTKLIKDSKLIATIEGAKKEILDSRNQNRILNQCKAKIVSKLSVISDRKDAEKLVEDVKKDISKNVFSKFSAHSRKLLEDYFQNKIAISNKSAFIAFGGSSPFERLKYWTESSLKNDYESFPLTEEAALTNAFALSDGINDVNDSEICSPKFEANIYDSYLSYDSIKNMSDGVKKAVAKLPPKDHIFISPFTCHHELRGRSVVAHELGHAINHIFGTRKLSEESAKLYKKIRQCSTDNYVNFTPDRTFSAQKNDGEKTEEDTADLLAYMAYPESGDLFSCAFIRPAINNKAYDELSFDNEDGDPHSTPLYRLIMEAVNKKRTLPVSCERALAPFKDQLRLKKCVP